MPLPRPVPRSMMLRQGMKLTRKNVLILALAPAALLIAAVTVPMWWQAKLDRRVDLRRQLIGRWAAEGRSDGLAAGSPPVLKGRVTRVPGRHGTAWSFDCATANVSVT